MHTNHSALRTYGPVIGRILIGALFVISGIGKAFGFAGTAGYIASVGLPMPDMLAALTILVEIGAGAMLVIGWRPRLAAWLLIVFVALATAIFHYDVANQTQLTAALKNLAIIGGLLMVATHGAGKYSVGCNCEGKYCPDCKAQGGGSQPAPAQQ